MPVRLATRKICVSTAMVGSPNATFSTTLAVLRPTPGNLSKASRSRGTTPPCCSTSMRDSATMLRALVRKRPIVRISSVMRAPPRRALSSPIMSATLDAAGPAGPPLADVSFERVLLPHRSLPPHGFRVMMGLLGIISIAVGIGFVSVGAWPICGFFGLDVALLYFAFRLNYRSARQRETLRLADDQFTVERLGIYRDRR